MMSKRKHIKEELKELKASTLEQWQGESDNWQMPAGYLDQLSEKVIEKSLRSNILSQLTSSKFNLLKVAAVVLFLIAGAWLFSSVENNSETVPLANLDNISSEEIEDYIFDNIEDFDLELLQNFALEADLNETLDMDDKFLENDWESNSDVGLF